MSREPLPDRLLPGLTQRREYRRTWLRGDVVAGVTVAAYLVPQVMAYATVAGLPAVAGLGPALALRGEVTRRGIVFALARVKQDLLVDLTACGLTAAVGAERIIPTLPTAVAAFEAWRRDNPPPKPSGD
jgi:MFS superfamily sulfate permease-like transporter